jgi:beta-1,3-galactosyltransferase 1
MLFFLFLLVVKYIMKSDDDTFVNVPNLVHVLLGGTLPVYKATVSFYDKISVNAKSPRNRLAENKYLLMGFKFCSAKPISDVQSKWYAPSYLFSGEFYPDYLSGTAYVMTYESAQRLYKGSLSTSLFHLEGKHFNEFINEELEELTIISRSPDVYLTGFVADKIKLKRQHHPLFFYLSTKDHCSLRGMLTQHQLTPLAIEVAYSFITNLTINCAVPEKNFMTTKLKLAQRKKCQ